MEVSMIIQKNKGFFSQEYIYVCLCWACTPKHMIDEMFCVEWGALEHMGKLMFCVEKEALEHMHTYIWVEREALEHMSLETFVLRMKLWNIEYLVIVSLGVSYRYILELVLSEEL